MAWRTQRHHGQVMKASAELRSAKLPGFTLVEVLLALALLVVIAAFAWPMLQAPFAHRQLRSAADRVRAAWVRAHVSAMNSDRTYIFRCTLDGADFQLQQWESQEPLADLSQSSLVDGGALAYMTPESTEPKTRAGKLPDGVVFAACETLLDTRAAMLPLNAEMASDAPSGIGWSDPIMFYPDGTTSTARLELRNSRGLAIELRLRGLTGVVNVSDVYPVQQGPSP